MGSGCEKAAFARCLVKLTDTVELVLKTKNDNRVLSIGPDQSVYEAVEKMAEQGVGALLVISQNRLVGILSERDYARKVILKGRSSKETQVHEIMSSPVVFVTRRNTVDECMTIMTKRHFRHLPVVDNSSKLLGMLSIRNLLEQRIGDLNQELDSLEQYVTNDGPGG